jgi:predicted PurR-regulated permease PerM
MRDGTLGDSIAVAPTEKGFPDPSIALSAEDSTVKDGSAYDNEIVLEDFMRGISNLLFGLAIIAYIVLGLFQLMAIIWGLDEFGVPWFLAGIIAFFLAYIPLVGSLCAAYGLVVTLGWSWPLAFGFPLVAMLAIGALGAAATWLGENVEVRG